MKSKIEFQGKRISYRIKGSGPVIVFLHGFLESKEMWNYFVKKLSDHFTVLSIDLPGHGESDVLDPIHSMEMMADSVHQVIRMNDLKSFVMAGHSMGGYVALAYARRRRRYIRGLILFHSHAAADSQEAKLNRNRAIQVIRSDRSGFIMNFFPDLFSPENAGRFKKKIEKFREQAESMDPEAITAALEGMKLRPASLDVLQEANYPVLFIAGKQDPRIPDDLVQSQSLIPAHAELCLLDHVGHMGFLEEKKKTCNLIEHFALRFA